MPVFRKRVALELVRNVRAFLNVEGGVTRGPVPEPVAESGDGRSRPRQTRGGELAETPEIEAGRQPVRLESLVWIFGSGKTGSTWLSHMMADLEGYKLWAEPDVGKLLRAGAGGTD
jgi:hypothetical protein